MFKSSKAFMPTYVLIALNVIVYAFTSYFSGNIIETSNDVLVNYGQYNGAIFDGEVWRLLTAMFIHASIVHLVGNMFFLLIFGLRAEGMFDIREYLLIYFLSGFAGGLLSLVLGPFVVSVGASGAIFGVLGATIIYIRRAIGQSIITALLYAFFLFAINIGPNVNYAAHLGGLAVGLFVGYVLAANRRPKPATTYEHTYQFSTKSQ